MEKTNEDFEMLANIIGPDLTRKIAETFAGSSVYIPKSVLNVLKHNEIREQFKAGKSYRELCLEYGYAESHMRKIVNQNGKDKLYQPNLFEQEEV
jgi:Mor family transcriptional regulator